MQQGVLFLRVGRAGGIARIFSGFELDLDPAISDDQYFGLDAMASTTLNQLLSKIAAAPLGAGCIVQGS